MSPSSSTWFISRREAVSFKGKLSKEIAGILLRMRELKDPERIPWFIELLLLLSRSDGQTSAGSFQKLSREETRLSQIHTWVICNADRKVSVGEIAAHVGMNKSAFCTFFRKDSWNISTSIASRLPASCWKRAGCPYPRHATGPVSGTSRTSTGFSGG